MSRSRKVNLRNRAQDREMMRRAIALGWQSAGRTHPNPSVGAIILDQAGNIAGEGYHERAGMPHAEAIALEIAGERARGGTLYVTLEPCSHTGRTPPCADAVIRAGIRRVVAAIEDPDERVRGSGFDRLRSAGVEVEVGVEKREAERLHEGFLKFKRTRLPFLLLKMAMTLDGRIATRTGDSRWVTSHRARARVHHLRDVYDAVMVGTGTIRQDNPRLTVRLETPYPGFERPSRNPLRVVVDSHCEISLEARVLHEEGECVILTTEAAPPERIQRLTDAGAIVRRLPSSDGRVDLRAAMLDLGMSGVQSVICEGGPTLAGALLREDLVDRFLCFVAPMLLADANAPGPLAGSGPERMREALHTGPLRVRRFPPDLAIEVDISASGTTPETRKAPNT